MADPTNSMPDQEDSGANPGVPPTPSGPSEADQRKILMDRARLMGIKFSPNISLEKLRDRIRAVLEAAEKEEQDARQIAAAQGDEEEAEERNQKYDDADEKPAPKVDPKTAVAQKRTAFIKSAMKLKRIRVTCLNQNKKDLHGEIFTVANEHIGTVTKFVPFGDATEDGYHVPQAILDHMKERKFLNIQVRDSKNPKDGVPVKTSYVSEFAIEELPQLTPAELRQLAIKQAVAAGQTEGVQ